MSLANDLPVAQASVLPTAVSIHNNFSNDDNDQNDVIVGDDDVNASVPLAEAHIAETTTPQPSPSPPPSATPHTTNTATTTTSHPTNNRLRPPHLQDPRLVNVQALPLEDSMRKYRRRKIRRAVRTHRGAVGGAMVGLIFLGPIGLSIGMASGAALAYGASKVGEKRKDKRFAQRVAIARRSSSMRLTRGVSGGGGNHGGGGGGGLVRAISLRRRSVTVMRRSNSVM